jgi:hypothetical protein
VPHVEQELFTLHEHLSSTPVLSGVRVTWHLVFCVMFLRSLFDLFPLANVFSVLWITASDYPFNSFNIALYVKMHKINILKMQTSLNTTSVWITKQVMQTRGAQTLVSFKKCMPPPLPYFKVNICSFFPLICDPFADPIISLHSRDISLFDCHI